MAETRGEDEHELPDGVIPLRREAADPRPGCRLTGCLYGMVVLFAVALAALLVGLLVRMWVTPSLPRMM